MFFAQGSWRQIQGQPSEGFRASPCVRTSVRPFGEDAAAGYTVCQALFCAEAADPQPRYPKVQGLGLEVKGLGFRVQSHVCYHSSRVLFRKHANIRFITV